MQELIVGVDLGSYLFEPVLKRITIRDVPGLTQEGILIIRDLTTGVVIYDFNSAGKGGVLIGGALNLTYDTTAMLSSDALQIVVRRADSQKEPFNLEYTNSLLEEIRDLLTVAMG